MPASRARSVARADRFADRTAANVAPASTSVPPAVASEEIVGQSATTPILRSRCEGHLVWLRPNITDEEDSMHAALVSVTIDTGKEDEARRLLNEQIVPMVKGSPGFVAGYWFAP